MLTPFADGHPLAAPIVHPGGRELRRLPRRPTRRKHWCREGGTPGCGNLEMAFGGLMKAA